MNKMTKHIGLHNAKNIIIILHQLQGEGHMCLVLYVDRVPPAYLTPILNALNSPEGQAAKDFASVLETLTLGDGRNLGQLLHTEGHFKKVPTNQVFATPDSRNKVRLNDLNEMLTRIDQGGDALKKLEELDTNKGMHNRKKPTDLAESVKSNASVLAQFAASNLVPADPVVLGNVLREESAKLIAAAQLLLHEAKSMGEKADALIPVASAPKKRIRTKKTVVAG